MTEQFRELDEFIDGLDICGAECDKQVREGSLITVLHHAQEIFGYLPTEVQSHIARRLEIPDSKVYGVVTFYSFFTIKPKGKFRINVCMGTACFVRGAADVLDAFAKELKIKAGETTGDMMFSLDALRCVGACGLAPVVTVNGKTYGRVKPEEVRGILDKCLAERGAEEGVVND